MFPALIHKLDVSNTVLPMALQKIHTEQQRWRTYNAFVLNQNQITTFKNEVSFMYMNPSWQIIYVPPERRVTYNQSSIGQESRQTFDGLVDHVIYVNVPLLMKGTTKVLLGEMPIIDVPFRRVAVDLVGPIQTNKGNRNILTVVFNARYCTTGQGICFKEHRD